MNWTIAAAAVGPSAPNVDPQQFWYFVGGLFILLQLISLAVGIYANVRRRPPLEAEFATKSECEKCRAVVDAKIKEMSEGIACSVDRGEFGEFRRYVTHEMNELRTRFDSAIERVLTKLDEMKTELMALDERRAVTLHNRVNDLQAQIARVDERTRGHHPNPTA